MFAIRFLLEIPPRGFPFQMKFYDKCRIRLNNNTNLNVQRILFEKEIPSGASQAGNISQTSFIYIYIYNVPWPPPTREGPESVSAHGRSPRRDLARTEPDSAHHVISEMRTLCTLYFVICIGFVLAVCCLFVSCVFMLLLSSLVSCLVSFVLNFRKVSLSYTKPPRPQQMLPWKILAERI